MSRSDGPLLPLPPAPVVRRRVPPDSPEWAALRTVVLERDGWICQRCHRLCAPWNSPYAKRRHWATVDHIVPRARGGWDSPVNAQVLCVGCNERKGDSIVDYRADVALRLALDDERRERELIPDELRHAHGGIVKGAEPLSVVVACRVTPSEAAALEAAYGSRTYGLRAGVDRVLYAAS